MFGFCKIKKNKNKKRKKYVEVAEILDHSLTT
jgi:hypothetical protein